MPRRNAWRGALAGAVGLLAASWLGAPPARAQDTPDMLACSVFSDLINEADAFCSEQGCAPTEKECDRFCKDTAKACGAIARRSAKAEDDATRGEARQDKVLCTTAEDPTTCKSTVKSDQKDARATTQEFKKEFKQACESEALSLQCVSACSRGLRCFCVGGLAMNCI